MQFRPIPQSIGGVIHMFDELDKQGRHRWTVANQFTKVQAGQEKHNQVENRCVLELTDGSSVHNVVFQRQFADYTTHVKRLLIRCNKDSYFFVTGMKGTIVYITHDRFPFC